MTEDELRGLSDEELVLLVNLVQLEMNVRDKSRKQESIAKINDLANSAGLVIRIVAKRGRPAKNGARNGISKYQESKRKIKVPNYDLA